MKILVDTNVIADFLMKREPHKTEARRIIALCSDKEIDGYIAAHTIPDLFYILRKDLPLPERRAMLLDMCNIFTVSSLDGTKLIAALRDEDFRDFEDCLQDQCAMSVGADYIVTRNVRDFANARTEAITPSNFIKILQIIL